MWSSRTRGPATSLTARCVPASTHVRGPEHGNCPTPINRSTRRGISDATSRREVLPAERLFGGGADDYLRRRATTVLRRLGGVEVHVLAPQLAVEVLARRMDVEEASIARSLVAEGVDHVRRHQHEHSGARDHPFGRWPDLEDELPVKDVERVRVLMVHVRVRAALAGGVDR